MTERLDHLAAAGITALELMPVTDFPGRWNWGYDGVLTWSYGEPVSTEGGVLTRALT
jgi:maltooligosyltrehalose trehalohydrolase